ncbi:unnamed protein product [Gongylonema pulchrum]|uniref:G_PROTEIN_RECEP_F1_2 domain-containing protein n=1 Tax=Gongylonema pulchrum TaxID=637853 RepID=A0A183E8Z9_9BILA|nr:unnamed protein product [Gongylonema pulchrum]
MGTSLGTLLQYASQSAITQLFLFIVVFFIYGWHNLDADVRIMIGASDNRSLLAFLLGATSPLYTALLFTSVPAFLVHIDYATAFISSSKTICRFFGYLVLFGPAAIILVFIIVAYYISAIRYKMIRNRYQPIRQPVIKESAVIVNRMLAVVVDLAAKTVVNNALYTRFIGSNEQAAAGNFRTILFVGLITFHILSLLELRWTLKRWDHSSR